MFLFATTVEGVLLYCLAAMFVVAVLACYLDRGSKAGGIMGLITMVFMVALGASAARADTIASSIEASTEGEWFGVSGSTVTFAVIEGNSYWLKNLNKETTFRYDVNCQTRHITGKEGYDQHYSDLPPRTIGREMVDFICGGKS